MPHLTSITILHMAPKDLLSKRVDVLDKGFIELQDVMGDDLAIVNAARVSFLGESKGEDKDKKLLFYLLKNRHTSPFEQVEFKFRVRAPVVTWWQWVRHRTWCLAGDTPVTFARHDHLAPASGVGIASDRDARLAIQRLYTLWQDPHGRSTIRNMPIRVYNEENGVFTTATVADVMYSGRQEVFEIELEEGQALACTRHHLLLTADGWQRLEDAVGLSVTPGGTVTMRKDCQVVTHPTGGGRHHARYSDVYADWDRSEIGAGVAGTAGAVRHATLVPDQAWFASDVKDLAAIGLARQEEIRHAEPLGADDADDQVGTYQKVVKIRRVGVRDTYDIAVNGPHHNFVAGGLVVHNSFNAQSGRYVAFEERDFYVPDVWRKQSPSNKQASLGELDLADGATLTQELLAHYDRGYALYQQALAQGVAREQARVFLPGFSVYYTWVCKVDAHNLMHFLSLRMADDAQYEIRVYAQAIYDHFFKPALPWTAEAFEKFILPQHT